MIKSVQLYTYPYDPEIYSEEPSDEQAVCLARMLAHFAAFYYAPGEVDMAMNAIVLDVIESTDLRGAARGQRLLNSEVTLLGELFKLDVGDDS